MKKKIMFSLILVLTLMIAIPFLAYHLPSSCPQVNKNSKPEVIIVLGNPANNDCSPGELMMERLDKAIEIHKLTKIENFIFCGGKAANSCTESIVMKNYTETILTNTSLFFHLDSTSTNTYQNAQNAIKIMNQNKWKNAIIVTSKFHSKRSCGIFNSHNIEYTMKSSLPIRKIGWFKRLKWKIRESLILSYHLLFGYNTNIGLVLKTMSITDVEQTVT